MNTPFDYEAWDRWQHIYSYIAPLYYASIPLLVITVGKARSIAFKLDKLTWAMAAFMFPTIWILDYLRHKYLKTSEGYFQWGALLLMLVFAALLARPLRSETATTKRAIAFKLVYRCIAAFAVFWWLWEAQIALEFKSFDYWLGMPK